MVWTMTICLKAVQSWRTQSDAQSRRTVSELRWVTQRWNPVVVFPCLSGSSSSRDQPKSGEAVENQSLRPSKIQGPHGVVRQSEREVGGLVEKAVQEGDPCEAFAQTKKHVKCWR